MADNADRAAELMEHRMATALRARQTQPPPVTAPECEDCGEEIPAARRRALPWAARCVECQTVMEGRKRHVR